MVSQLCSATDVYKNLEMPLKTGLCFIIKVQSFNIQSFPGCVKYREIFNKIVNLQCIIDLNHLDN